MVTTLDQSLYCKLMTDDNSSVFSFFFLLIFVCYFFKESY